jgi:hypothetical protein
MAAIGFVYEWQDLSPVILQQTKSKPSKSKLRFMKIA